MIFRAPHSFCIVLPQYCLLDSGPFFLCPFFVFHNANEGLPWSRDFYQLLISIGGDCAPALLIPSWGTSGLGLARYGCGSSRCLPHSPTPSVCVCVCVDVCSSHSNPFSPLCSVLTDSLLESAGHSAALISLINGHLRIPGIGCELLGSPLIWQRTIGNSQNQSF